MLPGAPPDPTCPILLRVQRLSSWIDKELSEGGELAKALDSVKETLKGPTISNPSKTFNSVAARCFFVQLRI